MHHMYKWTQRCNNICSCPQVRSLEQQNTILKAQINLYNRSDPSAPANASVVATTAVAGYKAQIETLTHTKTALLAEIDHYKQVIEEIQVKWVSRISHKNARAIVDSLWLLN